MIEEPMYFFTRFFDCLGYVCLYYTRPSKARTNKIMLLLLSHCSHAWLCATPWMAAHEALPSLGFSRQEHWSGMPFPSPAHCSTLPLIKAKLLISPCPAFTLTHELIVGAQWESKGLHIMPEKQPGSVFPCEGLPVSFQRLLIQIRLWELLPVSHS